MRIQQIIVAATFLVIMTMSVECSDVERQQQITVANPSPLSATNFDVAFVNCTLQSHCSDNGICIAGHCICEPGYLSHNCAPGMACCYEQKSKITAIALQSVFGIMGAGYMYIPAANGVAIASWVLFGALALSCCCACLIMPLCLCAGDMTSLGLKLYGVDGVFGAKKSDLGKCAAILVCVVLVALVGLWITGIVQIAGGHVLDINGQTLH